MTLALSYYRTTHQNILVQALPEIDFSDDILGKMSFLPPVPDSDVRKEPARRRLDYLNELWRIHVALNRDRDLAESVNSMIRASYLARGSVPQQRAAAPDRTAHLLNAANDTQTQSAALEALIERSRDSHLTVETRSLFGVSGSGKTRTIAQVASLFPRTIEFPSSKDPRLPPIVIPVLTVEAPADRTIPSLHTKIVSVIEGLISCEIPSKFKRGNRSERIQMLGDILQHFHVGVLFLDEIQKLVRSDGKPDYILLNFILEIANTLKIPIVFVGTPASQRLLAGTMRNARRMLGRPWANFTKDSSEWQRLVSQLWPYQFTERFTPLNPELSSVIYDATVGLPGLMVRLFRECQRVAILANMPRSSRAGTVPETITPALINAVASALFSNIRPMLNAIRGGVLEEIACFEDLTLDDKVVEMQARELAEHRRREFHKTIRAIRSTGTIQRRRARAAIRQEIDALIEGPGATALISAEATPANNQAAAADAPQGRNEP